MNTNLKLLSLIVILISAFSVECFSDDALKTETEKIELERKDVKRKHVHRLESVVITGDSTSSNLLQSTTAGSVVTKEELVKQNTSTLGETLAFEPGVSTSFFGQGSSRPVIRGFSGSRVGVLQNGLKTGDVSDISEDHIVTADPMQADKIEVLRGAKTILYGSSASGGVVNIIDESIAETALEKPFSLEYVAQFGDSADNEKTFGLKTKFKTENVNWFVSGFSRRTSSFEIPGYAETDFAREQHEHEEEGEHHGEEHEGEHHDEDEHHGEEEHEARGRVNNSDTETVGFTLGSSYVKDNGFVGFSVSGLDSDYGVSGHVHVDDHGDDHDHDEDHHDEDEDHHEDEDHDDHDEDEHEEEHGDESVRIESKRLRYAVRGEERFSDSNIKAVKYKLAYTDYEHRELEGGSLATLFERDTFETRLDFVHNPISVLEGFFGLQFVYDDFFTGGAEAFTQPVKTYSPALYFFEATNLTDNLNLELGGRVEYVHYDPEVTATENFTPFSISLGANYILEDYEFGLTASFNQRAPQVTELFSNGAHLARGIFEVGDLSLDNEESVGLELLVRKNSGLITGEFTPFIQKFSNYINLDSNGEEMSGLSVFNYNQIDATFSGFEFQTQFNIDELLNFGRDHLHIGYQIDYVRAYNDSNNSDLPRIPPFRQIVSLGYSFKDLVEAEIQSVFASSQNNVGPFETETDSYQLLNANVSFRISDSLRFFVRGTNLTNDEARRHASFLKDTIPLRGRAFLFGVTGTI